MKKVKIQLLTIETPESFEKHSGLSETVPGQSLPIRDILINFQRGTLDENIQKQVYYDDIDQFITDPTMLPDFDLADATILQDKLTLFIQEQRRLKSLEEQAKIDSETALNASAKEGV